MSWRYKIIIYALRPFFRIDWFFNGNPLQFKRGMTMSPEGTLEIESISKSNDGFYQCTATNSYGKAISRVGHLHMAGNLKLRRCHDTGTRSFRHNNKFGVMTTLWLLMFWLLAAMVLIYFSWNRQISRDISWDLVGHFEWFNHHHINIVIIIIISNSSIIIIAEENVKIRFFIIIIWIAFKFF